MMQKVYYPLTHAQKRIWYTEQFYPGTSISNLGGFIKLKSETEIDPHLLVDAIRHFIRLNDSMRLRLALNDGGEPRQYLSEYQEFDIKCFDYSASGDFHAAMEWGQAEADKPMALYDTDLFDCAVFKISNRESWFFAKVHHVISDGISMVLVANQIIDLYLELVKGVQEPRVEHPSYLEHIQSELAYERSERFRKDKEYWNAQFSSIPEFTSLKRSESYRISTEAVRFSKIVPESLYRDLQLFCKEYNISELSLFLSLLHIYMYRATGQNDVAAGTFMANRTNAKEKRMLGMFVSTIPIRTNVDENMDFLSFVRQRMKALVTVIRHQKYPYDVLVNDLREKHGNVSKLFGVSLEFQVMQWHQKENISYLSEPLFSRNEINDISIHVKERWDTGTLAMDIDYRTEIFNEDEIENLFCCMMTLLKDALAHPAKKLCELQLYAEEEKQQLLKQCSGPGVSYPRDTTLHGLFEEQAATIPEQTAVVHNEEQRFTYKELNEQSNRLGRVLRAKGIGPDTPVAILMERSGWMPTVILGILKAGGVYVPIDPSSPEERIHFMLHDAGAKLLIIESHLLQRYDLQAVNTEILVLDEALLNEGENGNLPESAGSCNLAYIIYTSGTTGKPKGVMIEHRQVLHLIEGLRRQVYSHYDDTALHVALLAPFHFDASVQQIFASLLLGHTLFIVPRSSASDGKALAAYYRSQEIDITDGTPAHLQLLLAAGNLQGVNLRQMLIGGEALPHETVRDVLTLFAEHGTAPVMTNMYGPTECCVDASTFDVVLESSAVHHTSPYVPIGKPLGNNRLYILGRIRPSAAPGCTG